MKKWKDIAPATGITEIFGETDREVSGIAFDSRKVEPDSLFVAQRGTRTNGLDYIPMAIERGAGIVVAEALPEEKVPGVLYVKTDDANRILGHLAAAWYDYPSAKLKLTGVTGTNGKTSIATLLYQLFTRLGFKAGLLSTISTIVGDRAEDATHTTPDALRIQQLLAEMVDAGCDYCFMEVSSHAVVQQRIAGLQFTGGIFTNLTHDHLDYHKTFAEYLKAKKGFFDMLPASAFAITNLDDKNGLVMTQNSAARVVTYSTRTMANYRCKVLEPHFDGMLLQIDNREVWTRFVGRFNAANLLAVYSCALQLGQSAENVLQIISELQPVTGRFDAVRSPDGKLGIVDYAHTPDALKNVLGAIAEIRTGNEKVITVVGAGGDRDKTKRPEMAREAVIASDLVILTSDNPRTEDPETIIHDMEAGVDKGARQKVMSITNRREAIKTAVNLASPGDIILVAGKGHENYQEVQGVKHHFDDKEELAQFFALT